MSKELTEESYNELLAQVSVISHPLASRKLTKKIHKLVKKSVKEKTLKRGVREVVKAVRKGTKGIVVMAGDVSPIDVVSHIPVLCEDAKVEYVFVPSKELLGIAVKSTRPTSCVLISSETANEEEFKELESEIQNIHKK